MRGRTSVFSRLLTAFVAAMPLLAGADVCTIGAVTGRASLACPLETAAAPGASSSCHVASVTAPRCSHCAPVAPERETPRPVRDTCCGMRPQAPAAAEQPVVGAPAPNAHPAWTDEAAAVIAVTVSRVPAVSDDGRAPPADLPPTLSPRAPPQA